MGKSPPPGRRRRGRERGEDGATHLRRCGGGGRGGRIAPQAASAPPASGSEQSFLERRDRPLCGKPCPGAEQRHGKPGKSCRKRTARRRDQGREERGRESAGAGGVSVLAQLRKPPPVHGSSRVGDGYRRGPVSLDNQGSR